MEVSEKDKSQDEQIKANSEKIASNSERIDQMAKSMETVADVLEEICKFHMPWRGTKWAPYRAKFYKPLLKVLAFITLWTGAIKTGQWYWNYCKLDRMAKRYVTVANRMYYEEGNPDIALEFLDKAIKLQDDNADYKFLRAYIDGLSATRMLLNLGRPFNKTELDRVHRVLAEAEFLAELEPSRAEPYLLQGQILEALNEYGRAETALSRAKELDPRNDFIFVRLAQLQIDRKEYDSAAYSLEKALELNTRSKWAWLWKGILAREQKDEAKARECYAKASEIDPKFDLALYNEGWTWKDEKQYGKARDCMLKALKINPAYKEACFAIGMFYGYEDNYPAALVWMDKALAMDGNFFAGYEYRGLVKWEMKNFAGALTDYDKAIHLDPMNAKLYIRRAKVFEATGDKKSAERDRAFAAELKGGSK